MASAFLIWQAEKERTIRERTEMIVERQRADLKERLDKQRVLMQDRLIDMMHSQLQKYTAATAPSSSLPSIVTHMPAAAQVLGTRAHV